MKCKWLIVISLALASRMPAFAQLGDYVNELTERKINQESFHLYKSINRQFRYSHIKANMLDKEIGRIVKDQYPRVYAKQHFFSLFPVDFEAAFVWDKKWGDSLFNGAGISVSFYEKLADPLPVAYFYGAFRDGYADGYGMLVTKDRQSENIYVKRGFWSKGRFMHEKEAETTASYYANTFEYGNAFGEGAVSNIKSQILSVNYNWDPISGKYTNGRYILDKVSFDFGGKREWMLISIAFTDFYSNVDLSFHTASDTMVYLYKRQIGRKLKSMMERKFSELVNTIINTGSGSYFDEHTVVQKDPWNNYGFVKCYNRNVVTEYGLEEDAYVNSGSRTVHIYTRKQKTDPWEAVRGEWTIVKNADCDGTTYYTNTETGRKGGVFFRTAFGSEEDAIRDIVHEARSSVPYGSSDRTGGEPVVDLQTKRELLIKRIADVEELKFNEQDTLVGAWYCRRINRIYFIYPGYLENTRNLVFLPLDDEYLGHENGYRIDAYGAKWYKTDNFHGYCVGEWRKVYGREEFSCNTWDTYRIKELKKDAVIFRQYGAGGKLVDGDIWERVTETTTY
jgi:hypothetical protein